MRKKHKLVSLLLVLSIYGCSNIPNNNLTPTPKVSASGTMQSSSPNTVLSTPLPSNQEKFNPENSEFKIGKSRSSFQGEVSTVLNDDGSSITTWSALEGSVINIYAQMYNKEFKPEGDEFKVNTLDIASNEGTYVPIIKYMYVSPKVISDNDNGFIISWTNNGKLYLRKYDKNGYASNPEFNPKFSLKGEQFDVIGSQRDKNIILPDKNGGYFIIGGGYAGQDFSPGYGQVYDKSFNPVNDLIKIPSDPVSTYGGRDKQGNILLVFWKYDTSIGNLSLYGQRYKADATPLGEIFKIKDISRSFPKMIGFSMDGNGNFVLAGENQANNPVNNNSINRDVYFEKYDSNNNQINFEPVNTKSLESSNLPITEVSMNENGDFVVTWGDEGIDHAKGDIYARRYDKNGQPKEKEFKVNYISKGFKAKPEISLNNNGDFLIAWPNWNDNQNSFDIYARKYNINKALPNDDPALIPKENINCQPDEAQANEIKNQKSYTGELKIKVKNNDQVIELKSKEDFENIIKNTTSDPDLMQITINGQSYMYSTSTITIRLNKSGCFDEIFAKYGIKNTNDLSGFSYIYSDYKKAPVDKFEELLRKFIVKENLQVSEIEFSTPKALAAFALYMELKLNYSYLFENLYFSPIAVPA